jgi:hypothetical protein
MHERHEGGRCPGGHADGSRQIVSSHLLGRRGHLADDSVCFQVPAVTLEFGVTIVISPLVGEQAVLAPLILMIDYSFDARSSVGSEGQGDQRRDVVREVQPRSAEIREPGVLQASSGKPHS